MKNRTKCYERPKNHLIQVLHQSEIIDYYQEAGPDYGTWSPGFNMHFGLYERGLNPFNLESLLENMTLTVLDQLGLNPQDQISLVDLGCGLGASLRTIANKYPQWRLQGFTIVPWQVQQAQRLNEACPNISITERDYCDTKLPSNSVDAVIALESACYAQGPGKADLIKEMYRILKPGGKMIIADGFIKSPKPLTGWKLSVYKSLCNSWALKELPNVAHVYSALIISGFRQVAMKDVSWSVAPSVAHVPFKVLRFLIKELFFGNKPMTKARWDNLRSPLLTMILGLARNDFGYYLMSGLKPKPLKDVDSSAYKVPGS